MISEENLQLVGYWKRDSARYLKTKDKGRFNKD